MTNAERKWLKVFPNLAPEKIMEQFIPLLGAAWKERKHSFSKNDLEDSITRTLYIHIQKAIREKNTAWGLHYQPEVLEEGVNGVGRIIGRCDLTISAANYSYIYECKRLWTEGNNALFTKSARLYVTEGLCRFLQPSKKQQIPEPQYSSWLKFAGMLGYVMDGTTVKAFEAIKNALGKYAPAQRLESPCLPTCPTGEAYRFCSTHINCVQKIVHAHHILLSVCASQ